ncbi:hypothetical protein LEM8419_00992 [Neolewinella maritima]|uniref:Acetolactate decarboxylase n=1 Tax=Neolewinella maritima TaxID=1383882 RepID=A0ABN8F0A5_9BACT|nr:acetolactate decarboxylase [Neolewinella maritima]CAH0999692.1 hypothetical protein LEM8419_00992 [Neolewinella maritima]
MKYCSLLLLLLLTACDPNRPPPGQAITSDAALSIAGTQRATLYDGRISGSIDLNTIENLDGLYGLGPAEYLRGAVLVFDGKGYRSQVTAADELRVEETLRESPPFFVYTHQRTWNEYTVPSTVRSLKQFTDYLDQLTIGDPRPFAYRLAGPVRTAKLTVLNLKEGLSIESPEEAERGQLTLTVQDREVDVLGFFSTAHQGVFTDLDSYTRMHLITRERDVMGRLSGVTFGEGMKLFLPE